MLHVRVAALQGEVVSRTTTAIWFFIIAWLSAIYSLLSQSVRFTAVDFVLGAHVPDLSGSLAAVLMEALFMAAPWITLAVITRLHCPLPDSVCLAPFVGLVTVYLLSALWSGTLIDFESFLAYEIVRPPTAQLVIDSVAVLAGCLFLLWGSRANTGYSAEVCPEP
jgi:hypothetical protein